MKTILLSLCAFGLLQSVALAGIQTDIPPTNRVILKSGAWTPTEAEAEKALAAIESFLEKPTLKRSQDTNEIAKIRSHLSAYRVQFVGEKRGGKKVIWCNFFPAATGREDDFKYWKQEKVQVMDGGYWFWQIDYDPDTGSCTRFLSNGYA